MAYRQAQYRRGRLFLHSLAIAPSSPAHHAGLRSGDLVDLRLLSPGDRYRWTTGWWLRGGRIDLPVIRGNAVRHVTLVARWYPMTLDEAIANAGILWMLIFAGAIAWLRPERREARVLALLLILYNIGLDFQPQNWITPWPALDGALATFSWIPFYAGPVMLAAYTTLFARPPTLLRRILVGATYASAGIVALLSAIGTLGLLTLTFDPLAPWYSGQLLQLTFGSDSILPYCLSLLCLLMVTVQAKGIERTRIAWATAPLVLLYASQVLVNVEPARWTLYVINGALFLAPLGLTYSLLNRRVLDIGFAINRAAVFTTVSAIVVGIFVLAEWALSEWFSTASHTTNLAIGAVLALALGLSVRAIHVRVDRVLDTLFFRKRHEDEESIRVLAREAAYITDRDILIARTIGLLEERADASSVRILLDDEDGHYGAVGENDPAIVRLRASRKALDLHDVQTALNGEVAYPMIARGRLVGALVLGPKRSGESYAPDESEAIMQLAGGVAAALDVLSLKGDSPRNVLLNTIRALSDNVSKVSSGFERLPDAVVERLRQSGLRP